MKCSLKIRRTVLAVDCRIESNPKQGIEKRERLAHTYRKHYPGSWSWTLRVFRHLECSVSALTIPKETHASSLLREYPYLHQKQHAYMEAWKSGERPSWAPQPENMRFPKEAHK
jgi:hypothetical protein